MPLDSESRQTEPRGPESRLLLMQVIACAVLTILFAGIVFSVSSSAVQSLNTGLAVAMSGVTGLAAASYRAIRELEKRVARLENPQNEQPQDGEHTSE